jgi:hypothetical protein
VAAVAVEAAAVGLDAAAACMYRPRKAATMRKGRRRRVRRERRGLPLESLERVRVGRERLRRGSAGESPLSLYFLSLSSPRRTHLPRVWGSQSGAAHGACVRV